MLIEFTVKNFMSFKDEMTFSMLASGDTHMEERHVIKDRDTSLLRSAAVFGPNGGGKSCFLKAVKFMRDLVINSVRSQIGDIIPVDVFRLNAKSEKDPSLFEVIFLLDGVRYRYGFEVTRSKVVSEWLFAAYSSRETKLFLREPDKTTSSTKMFPEYSKNIRKMTRDNALLLSVLAQFNGEKSKKVMKWFYGVNLISGLSSGIYNYDEVTMDILEDDENNEKRKWLNDLIVSADIGIDEIAIKKEAFPPEELLRRIPREVIPNEVYEKIVTSKENIQTRDAVTQHKKFNENDSYIGNENFSMEIESEGTKQLFNLLGPIIETIYSNKILFIDEIESSLHPLLLEVLIDLFAKGKEIGSTAQFVFTTHDTRFLSADKFRRDQLWFVEKNKYGASEMFSLAEFNKVRKDMDWQKNYLNGRYGAVPNIGEFDFKEADECGD